MISASKERNRMLLRPHLLWATALGNGLFTMYQLLQDSGSPTTSPLLLSPSHIPSVPHPDLSARHTTKSPRTYVPHSTQELSSSLSWAFSSNAICKDLVNIQRSYPHTPWPFFSLIFPPECLPKPTDILCISIYLSICIFTHHVNYILKTFRMDVYSRHSKHS